MINFVLFQALHELKLSVQQYIPVNLLSSSFILLVSRIRCLKATVFV